VDLNESLVAEFVAAMMIDIDSETKSLQRSKGVDPLPVEEASVAATQPLLNSGGAAASLKVVFFFISKKCFLEGC